MKRIVYALSVAAFGVMIGRWSFGCPDLIGQMFRLGCGAAIVIFLEIGFGKEIKEQ